ncbi:MAG: M28 family peptidase [Gemmataceae bacterium]|nr:M28 family peptidase [Gemmata sp.]MDW8198717.1 M28 family peptidase [Gemmataceae bacterium]
MRWIGPVLLAGLCGFVGRLAPAHEVAPAPRYSATEIDRWLIGEIRARSEIMKNLEYLSDRIGARLTGSANLEKANQWTAQRMKEYGLENVRLEPWEIPYGWERGKAEMKLVEPNTGRTLLIASRGWSPGTHGRITGDVVLLKARNKADLQAYRGKLKNAVVLLQPPARVAPILDPTTLPKAKDEPKTDTAPRDPPQDTPRKDTPEEVSIGSWSDETRQPGGAFIRDVLAFLKEEGAACEVTDAGKPHGLLVTTGSWGTDRAAAEQGIARVFMAHEHYALLYRLASRDQEPTRVEVEITNTFIPGPITVYNTIGEVRGRDKPDEIVVVGAHLDSWELASGTTDNGTGSCVILETARVVAQLARAGQRPRRTIRFCLFSGEEQGLWGSRKYVEKYKADLPKHSVALVHDTGTGKVMGFGLQGRKTLLPYLEPHLESLKTLEGWRGLDLGRLGGTDHLPFEAAGVPGFACRQEMDEYRLTHHTQTDTFDKAKEANLIQGAQVMAVTAVRIANLPELLPRK